jgi:2-polyprenyl-3-methyl-5-hydroxy-6-metoxy-1,4-benzoquinol methylase
MYLGPAALMRDVRSSVIDIGCGDGYGYHALREHNALSSYWGIDGSPSEIEKGRRLLVDPNHVMVCGDWIEYAGDDLKPADFVFCIEVLEHILPEERKACVEKCARYAKRNLFISTPPADRNDHGRLTIPECHELIRSVGLDVVVVDAQWTTLYVCSGRET